MSHLKEGFIYRYKIYREIPFIKGSVDFISNSIFQFVLLTVTPFYFAWLDIFADEKIKAPHYKVFLGLICLLCVVQLINLCEKKLKILIGSNDGDILKKAIKSFAHIVNQKIFHFKEECETFVPREDAFDKITRPDRQIKLILQKVQDIITDSFDIPEDCIDVNIMGNPMWNHNCTWEWFMTSPNKSDRTPAQVLISDVNSTARQALDSGDSIFYADKNRLKAGEHYHQSPRDRSIPSGSIYCCPISIKHVGGIDKYVFSVNTYKRSLCHYDNQNAIDFLELLFSEYKRRIQLELILFTLRKIRDNS